MTLAIFVLDVEEFHPLVAHARTRADLRVTGPLASGYYRLDAQGQAQGQVQFNRKALGLKPALWHGLLTGGLVGHIQHFDNDNLTLTEAQA